MIIGIDASRACRSERTGVESYVFHIIKNLALVIPQSTEVRLYSDREFPDDFAVHIPSAWKNIILRWPPKFLWTQVRLSFEMLIHPPDILFIPGHVEPLIHPKCSIMTVHDVAAWRFPHAYSSFDRWYAIRAPLRAYQENPLIIVPSIFTQREFELLARKKGVTGHGEIVVIPHGYEQASISSHDTAFLVQHGLSDIPYMLYIGRVEYKKNIDTIINSFEILKSSGQEFAHLRLVLAGGPGHGYEEIKELIQKSPYRSDILLLGWVSVPHKYELLTHAQALLLVSRYEGFGFPVLEGLALGVPVLASSNIGLEEVGGDLSLYVSPHSKESVSEGMRRIFYLSKTEREKIVTEGPAFASKFQWRKTAEKTYEALIRAHEIAVKS